MTVTQWFKDEEVGRVASSMMAMRIYDRIRDRYISDNPLKPCPATWDELPEEFQESFQCGCLEELNYLAAVLGKEFNLVPKNKE